MQWAKVTVSYPHQCVLASACPPPLNTQCPGGTTSLSLPAGTAASSSLRRPISRSCHHGNGSWRARGWRAPGRGPSPGVGCRGKEGRGRRRGGDGRGEKSPPHPPSPRGGQGVCAEPTLGPSSRGSGVPCVSSWGAKPPGYRLPALRTFFSRQVCGSPGVGPPSRALLAGVGAGTPTRTPHLAQPQPYLDVRHFRPRALTPARAWRRRHHFALANRGGGESQGGKEEEGSRVAPDVTGVADEQRPPLRRPPRPCLRLRSGGRAGAASRRAALTRRGPLPRPPSPSRAVAPEALPSLQ